MSESDKSSKSNWWENLMKSAKDKSINAIEVIKGDLAEFKSTMSNDATNLFLSSNKSNNETSEGNSESFLNSIAKSFNEIKHNLNLSDESCSSSKKTEEDKIPNKSMNERLRNEIENLKCDEGTYKTEPIDPGYSKWMQVFDPDEFKEEISKLLIENSTMRLIYSQMVPANLSNVEFWARYFFRLNLLNEEHMKRIKLIEKADSEINNEKGTDWDDDENFEDSNQNHNLIENETNLPEEKFLKNDFEDIKESNQKSKRIENSIDANQLKIKNDETSYLIGDEWEKIVVNENELQKPEVKNQQIEDENVDIKLETTNSNKNITEKRESLLNKIDQIETKQAEVDWEEWE